MRRDDPSSSVSSSSLHNVNSGRAPPSLVVVSPAPWHSTIPSLLRRSSPLSVKQQQQQQQQQQQRRPHRSSTYPWQQQQQQQHRRGRMSGSSNGTTKKKFWNSVKEQGRKVQLQGEIQWLKRQIVTRQKQLGVDLFDLVTNEKQTLLGVSAGTLFASTPPELLTWKEPLEQLQEGMRDLKDKHGRLEDKCQALLNVQTHSDDDRASSSSSSALDKIKIAAQRKQLQAQLLVLEQQMKMKKERFGVSIFHGLELGKDLSKLSNQEQRVQECIDTALADVHQLQAQINSKYSQVHAIHEEETEGLMMDNNNTN